MEIRVEQNAIETVSADAIIVNLFEGVKFPGGATGAVDRALSGAISELIAGGDLTGKPDNVAVIHPRGAIVARRVIVVGLGKADKFNLEAVREASAVAIKEAQKAGAVNVATIIHGGGIGGLDVAEAAQAVVEGSLLALYQYPAPGVKTAEKRKDEPKVNALTLVEFDPAKIPPVKAGAETGRVIAEIVTFARTLINQPSNAATPAAIAQAAQELAEPIGLACRVMEEVEMRAEGMGALLAVTQGATQPAKMVILEHKPAGAINTAGPVVLVGKGITFDTGGYSLKGTNDMLGMKGDMSGAAAVIGALLAAARLNLPLHVVGLAPLVENMIGPDAYKPNDVVIAKNGVSVEIISTDAEGRLILADALCYADTFKPAAVIDIATLTGGKVVALGSRTDAVFANDDALCAALVAAGQKTAEPMWRLPLDEAYDRQLSSDVADIVNSGGREASSVTAARFLAHFIGQWPWAHLDIAGSEFYVRSKLVFTPRSYLTLGATAIPTRALIEFLRHWKN